MLCVHRSHKSELVSHSVRLTHLNRSNIFKVIIIIIMIKMIIILMILLLIIFIKTVLIIIAIIIAIIIIISLLSSRALSRGEVGSPDPSSPKVSVVCIFWHHPQFPHVPVDKIAPSPSGSAS